ncbi:glycosyltransferase [Pseudomonas entomophila]|uniref:glycosyltransferase n=1 Tax=Pseudomonas entomophila TaxID=312306 RepID=UPI0023D8970F|nr:glycosyltransferase [Pseudomonas entomophila]MDF0732193.1 glycosyltransferase [Pseudomonas entomophila]
MPAGAIFISFDAVAVSGITVEALKLAKKLLHQGIVSHLDLGYEIKIDKGNFNKPYDQEKDLYNGLFNLVRVEAVDTLPYYNVEFIAYLHSALIAQTLAVPEHEKDALLAAMETSAQALSQRIVQLWESLDIRHVIVENGTLPENIIYTRALYLAIEAYGNRHALGRFVIWRDHDLMWSSEKTVMKYGPEPYPHAIKPVRSAHITYVTLNEDLKRKLEAWCDHQVEVQVRKNTYDFADLRPRPDIKERLDIRASDLLIARTTRLIAQKRPDRDIHLVHALNRRFIDEGKHTRVYLALAGDPHEQPGYAAQLVNLISDLQVEPYVKFLGALSHDDMPCTEASFTVEDLYHACDVVSFLTSWGYDSYGNPIGEAISSQRCYITSHYEYYQEVYGQHGFQAPILQTSQAHDGLPDDGFVEQVYQLLNDSARREAVARHNFDIGKRVLSNNVMDMLDLSVSGGIMRDAVFVSVVLPVYNESDRIDAVLESLFNQRSHAGLVTHATYELIIVDNNSTDDSVAKIERFRERNPSLDIHVITETVQGVSSARKRGMDYASLRSKERDIRLGVNNRHYIASADADCTVDPYWLHALIDKMVVENGDLGTCNYYYNEAHFGKRPNLYNEIQKTLRCREMSFSLFGGFPDGKGFAVERQLYDRVGGIEIFYQLDKGRFVEHLSDDWDFGIRVIAWGGKPVYAHDSRIEINSRRVDTILDEVITGNAYGQDGIIIMKDVRPDVEQQTPTLRDTTPEQSRQAWEYSIKDYVPKNIVLPALLNPQILLENPAVRAFFGEPVADRLYQRIHEIKQQSRVIDFKPIHAYKTPSYRLYFEFREDIFSALRRAVGDDIGFPPPLPTCLDDVEPDDFQRFVHYFAEDRESGEAHNYFANGGVF